MKSGIYIILYSYSSTHYIAKIGRSSDLDRRLKCYKSDRYVKKNFSKVSDLTIVAVKIVYWHHSSIHVAEKDYINFFRSSFSLFSGKEFFIVPIDFLSNMILNKFIDYEKD